MGLFVTTFFADAVMAGNKATTMSAVRDAATARCMDERDRATWERRTLPPRDGPRLWRDDRCPPRGISYSIGAANEAFRRGARRSCPGRELSRGRIMPVSGRSRQMQSVLEPHPVGVFLIVDRTRDEQHLTRIAELPRM